MSFTRSMVRFVGGGVGLLAVACSDGNADTGAAPGTVDGGANVAPLPTADAGSERTSSSKPDAASTGNVRVLAKECKADGDCGGTAGISCIKSSDGTMFGGGPSNGYCSMDCSAAAADGGADPCIALGGHCLSFPAVGNSPASAWCALDCTTGGDGTNKCAGRLDLACVEGQQGSGDGLCQPLCSSDDDCGSRKCDPRFGVCVDKPSKGDALGKHCDGDPNGPPTCAGTCLSVGTIAKVCSSPCVQGDPNACRAATGNPDTLQAICGLSASANPGVGDLGFCSQLCDTDVDCSDTQDPGAYCDKRSIKQIGRGFCFWDADAGTSSTDGGSPGDAGSVTDGAGTDGG